MDVEKVGHSPIVGGNKMKESFVIIVWQIFIKINDGVPYDLEIIHLGICSKEIYRKKIFPVSSFQSLGTTQSSL